MQYRGYTKIYTDGSHSPSIPSTGAAVYDPSNSICRTWRLPPEIDVLTSELYALHQALLYLDTHYTPRRAVVYTDSLSSLHLLLSRHPASSILLVHNIQHAYLRLTNQGWKIVFQWVPSHTGIPGNDIADAAAKHALTEAQVTPLPLPLHTAKRLINQACHASWDASLERDLRITSMGDYRTTSNAQPWVRRPSRILDVAITRLRLGHTRLTAHLHRLHLAPTPNCPWCLNVPESITHFILQCPRHHSARVTLRAQLTSLGIQTFDLPTLLAATDVPPDRRDTVIRLTCAFLRKTNQLTRL